MKSLRLFIPILFALHSTFSNAQSGQFETPSITYDPLTSNLYLIYSEQISEASGILNGPEYFHDDIIIGGNPFFGTTQFQDGSVIYRNQRFENQEIGYDIYRDELFISGYDEKGILSKINLDDNKVQGFRVSGRTFIRLNESSGQENHPGTGYYELLYSGHIQVVAKRSKRVVPANDGGLYKYEFQVADKIYVYKDYSFNRITSKRVLNTLLKDEKKTLRAYYRENKQDLRKLETYTISICKYYDSLNTIEK